MMLSSFIVFSFILIC